MVKLLSDEPPREDVEAVRRIAAVLAHPFRMRLLVALAVESPLPADMLARRTGEPLHKVRRHLNVLVDQQMVGITGETRRGALKRYYALERRPWIDIDEEALLGDRDRRRSAVGGVRVIFEEATRAASNARLAERTIGCSPTFPAESTSRVGANSPSCTTRFSGVPGRSSRRAGCG